MEPPRIVVNAKVYPQATGRAVVELAEACQTAAEEAGMTIGLAPPMVELATLGRREGLDRVVVHAQHVDPLPPGSGTGWTTVEGIQGAGARAALLNHAEHKLPREKVAGALARLREAGLPAMVCADSMEELQVLAPMNPDALAVEPPQLIGGDISVTEADPAIVRDAAEAVRATSPRTRTFCGAGVKDGRDVAAALDLGAYGVLLASGVVKAPDPLAALRDLASGLP